MKIAPSSSPSRYFARSLFRGKALTKGRMARQQGRKAEKAARKEGLDLRASQMAPIFHAHPPSVWEHFRCRKNACTKKKGQKMGERQRDSFITRRRRHRPSWKISSLAISISICANIAIFQPGSLFVFFNFQQESVTSFSLALIFSRIFLVLSRSDSTIVAS